METREIEKIYDIVRQPDHTGENRCIPCTVVNVVIAAVVTAIIGLASVYLAVVSFALFAGVIYARGYLIPGTPAFTRDYFPDRVLRWFDKEPMPAFEVDFEADDIDLENVLLGARALEECADSEDLCLTTSFRATWHRELEELDDEVVKERLAGILDVDEDQIALTDYGRAYVVLVDAIQVGQWESRAALFADVAADLGLAERVDGWIDLSVEQRSAINRGLRVYLDRCPDCGGAVSMVDKTVESCCSSQEVLTSKCQDCGARLFEMRASQVEKPS